MTDYEKLLLDTLTRAKHTRTEDERARFFTPAEELSKRARNAQQNGRGGEPSSDEFRHRDWRLLSVQ